ncbi:Exonuclease SbcC [Candidatus Hydrogenisulfobacillus filiaventi]|uniref:Exonuclease SbcC n=1 Tax=Candidatus Hydrogenisulfobacillus filiaventi TaxID=2707344 RepID=A0A6F8ZEK2_9FIRM|nr:Exonuclease SbcC [Candidatus Hydrogenisulfobacillus filiaventi]
MSDYGQSPGGDGRMPGVRLPAGAGVGALSALRGGGGAAARLCRLPGAPRLPCGARARALWPRGGGRIMAQGCCRCRGGRRAGR